MQDHVIIVAGGVGNRMGTDLPKQFLEIGGKPVIFHTIEKFTDANPDINVVVVLHPETFELWDDLVKHHTFSGQVTLVEGGRERFFSVKNGLQVISSDPGVVAIHDAVRPFVDKPCISRCFDTARRLGNAVPAIPLVQSLREITTNGSKPVDRNAYRLVQTPQCFEVKLLKDAYDQEYDQLFTDDASVVERLGIKINLVEGNRQNIKLTTREDLTLAESICENWFDDC